MDRVQKLLFGAGLAIIICGMLFALAFSHFVEHRTKLLTMDKYESVFELISDQSTNANWQKLQKKVNLNSLFYTNANDVHAHSINMGILVILVALLYPLIHITRPARRSDITVLVGFVIAALTYPAGLLLKMFHINLPGEILAALGACLSIGIFAFIFIRISNALELIPDEE